MRRKQKQTLSCVRDRNRLDFDREPGEENIYRLYPDCPDHFSLELFNQFAYASIETLARGHVVLYFADYKPVRLKKRRWFSPRRRQYPDEVIGPEKLRQALVRGNWQGGLCTAYEAFPFTRFFPGWGVETREKELCILQEKLDTNLLQQTDFSFDQQAGTCGISLTVFPEATIKAQGNDTETMAYYVQTADYAISIAAEIVYDRVTFVLNPAYLSPETLVEQLQDVAARYNKTLEVTL